MKKQLEWDSAAPKLHESWHEKLRPFFESEAAFDIYQFLKKRREEGYDSLPRSDRTFGIFQDVPLDKVSLIVVGQEPYSGFTGNKPQSNGVAFDCSLAGQKVQPSLEYLYYCLQNNFPTQEIVQESSLKKWTDQGVFLTNASLTVEKSATATHIKLKKEDFPHKNLWIKFQKYLWEEVFNDLKDVPVILMGKAAKELKQFIDPFRYMNRIFETDHSSFWARQNDKAANGDYVFLKANNYIRDTKGEQYTIKWGLEKETFNQDLPF